MRPIFSFGSKPFTEVVQRLRLDVFRTAMAEGMNLIFTNNSAWGGSDGRSASPRLLKRRVAAETGGGRAQFVRLTAPPVVLEDETREPVAAATRQAHRSLALARAAQYARRLRSLRGRPQHRHQPALRRPGGDNHRRVRRSHVASKWQRRIEGLTAQTERTLAKFLSWSARCGLCSTRDCSTSLGAGTVVWRVPELREGPKKAVVAWKHARPDLL